MKNLSEQFYRKTICGGRRPRVRRQEFRKVSYEIMCYSPMGESSVNIVRDGGRYQVRGRENDLIWSGHEGVPEIL